MTHKLHVLAIWLQTLNHYPFAPRLLPLPNKAQTVVVPGILQLSVLILHTVCVWSDLPLFPIFMLFSPDKSVMVKETNTNPLKWKQILLSHYGKSNGLKKAILNCFELEIRNLVIFLYKVSDHTGSSDGAVREVYSTHRKKYTVFLFIPEMAFEFKK